MKKRKPQYDNPVKRPRGRPRKYVKPEPTELDPERQLVRTVQQAPYNSGSHNADWVELKGRIRAFMKETDRRTLNNALFVLLKSALDVYEKEKELLNE